MAIMEFSEDTVRHVARLSGIRLSPEEVSLMKTQLSDILNFVAKLSAVDTRGVAATSHVHGVVNAFREDIAKKSLALEDVQAIAPDFALGGFRVPKII